MASQTDNDKVSFLLDPQLRARLVRLARENERTLSQEIRLALRNHAENEEAEQLEEAA